MNEMPGVSFAAPNGTFYAFPRIEGLASSADFAMNLLRSTGVALAPGSAFGATGEGYVRLCFATSEDSVARALSALRAHIDARPNG
jgi:aspartate/methionine/tyrosine aminotransferase